MQFGDPLPIPIQSPQGTDFPYKLDVSYYECHCFRQGLGKLFCNMHDDIEVKHAIRQFTFNVEWS